MSHHSSTSPARFAPLRSALAIATIAITAVIMGSCSKMGELNSRNFTVTPSPLETNGGKVTATINGVFPEKYMKRKATVTITPVLRYKGGEATAQSASFQGEKVVGNAQTISYRLGGNFTLRTQFDYQEPMHQSELYLTFDVKKGKKAVNQKDVKVADGVISTSDLVKRTVRSAATAYADDNFQHVIKQKQDANIQFLINEAKIRNGELKSVSVQQFLNTLKDIQSDAEGKSMNGIEISSYASPEGALDFNTKLAQNRGSNTKTYVNKQLRQHSLDASVDSKYTAEDWEGFQQLVSQSNIQDKDLILRVLSMYTDPEDREKQIRNLSAAFTDLTKEILPQLRRSRIRINYDLIGRSDDQIEEQYKTDASKLSVDELLYAVTLTEDTTRQQEILKKTASIYPNDYRALNDLATIAYQQGDYAAAKQYVNQALAINANAPEANANKALIELLNGNADEASQAIGKAAGASNVNELMGNLALMQGNYAKAVSNFGDTPSNSAALAQLLSKDYISAATTLTHVAKPDAMTSYLKAIIAARTNNSQLAVDNLRDALQADPSLKDYAAKDLEFQSLKSDAGFQLLTR